MFERKYMSHGVDDCTGMRTNRTIKDVMGGYMGSRSDTVKQYKKSEKWKRDLKALKKQKKMLYSSAKGSGSPRDIKKIQKIREKDFNKSRHFSSNYSGDDSDSGYLLARNSS